MEFKKLAKSTINFCINRIIEILGLSILIIGFLLLISLISFSPSDPNFIFPESVKIKNLLGFRGSFTSDIFFQTIGFISLLIPFSFIISGVNIFLNKKIFLIIESIFYITLYSLFGSLFFSFFYPTDFNLYINGNGGFVGKYLETIFLSTIINLNLQVSYYFLILLISIFFLISIQFDVTFFLKIVCAPIFASWYKLVFSSQNICSNFVANICMC